MCSPAVLDKDGVSAAAIAGEFVSYLASKNITLSHQLRSIYEEYVTKKKKKNFSIDISDKLSSC